MATLMQEVLCTIHNLRFALDSDRVRALGQEPAVVGRCPMCLDKDLREALEKLEEARAHRRLLLQAIDLKRTLLPQ